MMAWSYCSDGYDSRPGVCQLMATGYPGEIAASHPRILCQGEQVYNLAVNTANSQALGCPTIS
jgi:hypothetical protein